MAKIIKRTPSQQKAMHERFAVARHERLNKDVRSAGLSVDETLRRDLYRLIMLSRQAGEDNGFVKRYYGMVQSHVVGENGFTLRCKIKNDVGQLDTAANKAVEQAWKAFSKLGVCEISGRMNLVSAQQLIAKTVAQDGDILIRHLPGANNRFGYAFQLFENDILDIQLQKRVSNDTVIKMGVEQNNYGQHIAYHLLTAHPGEYTINYSGRRYVRIPANEMLLPFPIWRTGQSRGVPWAHAALIDTSEIKSMRESILLATSIAAANQTVYERDPEQPPPDEEFNGEGEIIQELVPGGISMVPQGFKMSTTSFAMPDGNFGEFQKTGLRGVSSGLEVGYNHLANDYESVNFSSLRASVLEDREHWKRLQTWFIGQVMNPIFEAWLRNALLMDAIPGLDLTDLNRVLNGYEFKGRRWQWVDPLKDEQAVELSLKNGTTSLIRVLEDKGIDPEDFKDELKRSDEIYALLPAHIKQLVSKNSDGAGDVDAMVEAVMAKLSNQE
ncbi:hypothetical protein MAH1_33790 [Sessilibacter sp. MAH1]